MSWKPGLPIILESENFRLSPLTPDDVDDRVSGWFRDSKVMEYVDLPKNLPPKMVEKYIGQFDGKTRFCLGIYPKKSTDPIGFFHFYCNFAAKNVRTAVVIGEKDYWGKNVVIETREKLLDFLFDAMNFHKVAGAVFARNLPAVFNYKKQGFTCEGLFKEECPDGKGGWLDIYRFAMLKQEWQELKRAKHHGG